MPAVTGGRMYPPHPVFAKRTDVSGVTLSMQKGHRTYIGNGGAVLIINRKTEAVAFDKPGTDGERIEP